MFRALNMHPMKPLLTYLVVAAVILVTVVQCSSLRTRANQLKVARVRRIDEAGE